MGRPALINTFISIFYPDKIIGDIMTSLAGLPSKSGSGNSIIGENDRWRRSKKINVAIANTSNPSPTRNSLIALLPGTLASNMECR